MEPVHSFCFRIPRPDGYQCRLILEREQTVTCDRETTRTGLINRVATATNRSEKAAALSRTCPFAQREKGEREKERERERERERASERREVSS